MRGWGAPLEEQPLGWFASASLLTAVVVVFCGGGFGGSPPIEGQTEPLTLTLSAPEVCEASHPKGFRAHDLEWDEEEEVWRDVFFKWWS